VKAVDRAAVEIDLVIDVGGFHFQDEPRGTSSSFTKGSVRRPAQARIFALDVFGVFGRGG